MRDAAFFFVCGFFLVVLLFVFIFSEQEGRTKLPHICMQSAGDWSSPLLLHLFGAVLCLLSPQIKVTKLIAQVRVENITCTGEAFTYLNCWKSVQL